MPTVNRPLPPEPVYAEPCVYSCTPSVGWRYYSTGWERVCDSHRRGRRGDFVPDTAVVPRGPR